MRWLFLLFLAPVLCKPIISNKNSPACRNCIYNKPKWFSKDFNYKYNDCEKTATKDLITGDNIYPSTVEARRDENLCGEKGRYYERETRLQSKIASHWIISRSTEIIAVSFVVILYLSTFVILISK